MTGIKIELLDRTLKMSLVQGHTVVFGQNICYTRKKYYLIYLKSAVCEVLVILIRTRALVKNAHRASTS